jgi:hypothetical protein
MGQIPCDLNFWVKVLAEDVAAKSGGGNAMDSAQGVFHLV